MSFEVSEFRPIVGLAAAYQDPESQAHVDVIIKTLSRDKTQAKVKFPDKSVALVPASRLDFPLYPDVNQRFDYFTSLADLVMDKKLKSLFVTGEGGIGKDYTVDTLLESNYMVEDEHYVKIKGHCTPLALYETLQNNHTKVIIFSDCDSVLKDGISNNILKAVLDTNGRRYVKWLTSRNRGSTGFEFLGSAIFLSNLNKDEVEDAILSRSVIIDLFMSVEEKIERMEFIAPGLNCCKLSDPDRMRVLRVIDKYKHTIKNLNLRTYIKALIVYEQTKNIDLVRYGVINS